MVKCLGIALKGRNDCGSTDGRHTCAGQAHQNLDPTEWVYVPDGPLCEKWAAFAVLDFFCFHPSAPDVLEVLAPAHVLTHHAAVLQTGELPPTPLGPPERQRWVREA